MLFFYKFVFSIESSPYTEARLGIYLFHFIEKTLDV